MKAFIVFGQTGEYSDHSNWPVRGFTAREKAEAFEFELTKIAKAHHDACEVVSRRNNKRGYSSREWEKAPAYVGPDPGYRHDYTGTDYYTVEVEIE